MSTPQLARGLTADSVTVRYGGLVAVDGVTLAVRPGEIVGLIGPNGAGKTSLVDALTGFAGNEGDIQVDGERIDDLAAYRRRRRGVARTWQTGELFHSMTVRENVLSSIDTGGLRGVWTDLSGVRSRRQEEADAALSVVGLLHLADLRPAELSLGQQKLVGVARALVGQPKVILLDEPAAGLDSRESERFGSWLKGFVDGTFGVLLIEHDMRLVFEVCARVYVLQFGKIIGSGPAHEVRRMPAVRSAYLGDSTALEQS